MSNSAQVRSVAALFTTPRAILWLPAFAAAAIASPDAGPFLAPYLGPPNQKVQGGTRARVPGGEHFARTWAVIKPGFCGTERSGYAAHTISDHTRTRVPAHLISDPVQWIQVMLANVARDADSISLIPDIWRAGQKFAADIHGDSKIVRQPYKTALPRMVKYFTGVTIIPDQGRAFWDALDAGLVRRDLGGKPGKVNTQAVAAALQRHLPLPLGRQFMAYRPR